MNEGYVPNKVPKNKRVFNAIWTNLLVTWASYGYYTESLWLPGMKGGSGINFTGDNLNLMLVAIAIGCINLMIPIIDQYDKRNNEEVYIKIENALTLVGILIIAIASAIAHGFFKKKQQ